VAETAGAEGQLALAERSATDVQSTLENALDLLAGCHQAYLKAPAHLRRQWNQAFFLRLDVHDENIEHAEIAEPFATLADPRLARELDRHTSRGHTRQLSAPATTAASNGRGSNRDQIVGAAGFEPAISAPQKPRDNQASLRPVARG
jgi:hypothetical protein